MVQALAIDSYRALCQRKLSHALTIWFIRVKEYVCCPILSRHFYVDKTLFVQQFDLHQDSGVFRIDDSSGLLEARQSKTVVLTFNPTKSINYRRRIVLMVHEMVTYILYLLLFLFF